MTMHQGLDLSKFQKVSSDKTTTTLRHAKGHEIKIAHSAVSPKMREHIESLPVYMAEGGEAEAIDPDSPAKADDDPSAAPETEVIGNDDPSQAVEAPAQEVPLAPPAVQAPAPASAVPTPEMMSVQPAIQVTGVKPAAPAPMTPSQEMKIEGDNYRQDLALGQIKPETYQSLFAKQDTLGKIGTLFGLLLSGAGSGLSGQPNAVMEMMNKEISNDLEAQKSSHANAQNIYQMNLQHQMQLASIKNQEIQQQLAVAKTPAEIKALQAQAGHLGIEAKVKADANSRIQLNWNALHALTESMKKIPQTLADGSPNPRFQEAQQKLLMLSQGIQTENYSIADRAEASLALGKALTGAGGQGGEQEFQNGQTALRVSGNAPLAEDKAARHIPGIPGQASIPLTSQDREEILAGKQFQNQLQRFIDWTKHHSGDLNLKERAEGEALAAQVQGAYRLATKGGVYKEGEQGFISNIIDATPTKFFNEIRIIPKLKAVQRESAAQLDERLKSKGFQGYQDTSAPETKVMNGAKYQKVPGGWKKIK